MGTIALLDEAGTPAAGPRRKDVLLLVFLRMESGRPHPRSTLASLLWGETVERKARHSLTQALGRLQKTLPPGTLKAGGDLVECSAALPCDAAELQEALAHGDASVAASLHAGEFLPGLALGEDEREFERWAMLRRDELRTGLLRLLEQAADEAAGAGDWRRVLELASRAVAVEPFAETGHRHVMRALTELGERSRALQQYERLKTLLDRGFGDVPSDESAALAASIRAAAPETPPVAAPPVPESPAPEPPTPALAAPPPPPLPAPPSPAAQARSAPWRWMAASASAIAALGLIGMLLWRTTEAETGRIAMNPEPAAAADAAPCAPGTAQARVVEEVFHYGVRVAPGRPFEKMWVVQNTGDCTWSTDFHLQYHDSEPRRLSVTNMGIPLDLPVRPGETYPVAVRMQAPQEPGTYREAWQLRDGADRPVRVGDADRLLAGIVVPQPSYPICAPGEGRAALLATRYPEMPVKRPGDAFRYSWTLRNVGECTWSAEARMRRAEGRSLISRDSAVVTSHAVEPRQTYTFLVTGAAPAEPGVHREMWRVEDRGALVLIDGEEATSVSVRVLPPGTPATGPRLCLPAEARMRFLDENVPDSTAFRPGAHFTKRWTLVNSGPCAWRPDFRVRYRAHTGALLSLSQVDLLVDEVVHPGGTYTVEIPMRAPRRPGFYREDWSVFDHEGTVLRMGTAPYIAALIVVADR